MEDRMMRHRPKLSELSLSLLLSAFLFLTCSFGQDQEKVIVAPGGPGQDAQWLSAGKQAIGTSADRRSRVWFTLANGVMTEVLFPDVMNANVQMLQFVVVDPKTKKVETEWDDASHEIKALRADALTFQQINTARSGKWKITKTYVTDPAEDVVMIDVRFERKDPSLNLYFYYDPSLKNTGMGDDAFGPMMRATADKKTGRIVNGVEAVDSEIKVEVLHGMGSTDGTVASIIHLSSNILELNSGYSGVSDGMEQLRKHGRIVEGHATAKKGNVAQMARVEEPESFTVALAFDDDENYHLVKAMGKASVSLKKGFAAVRAEYEKGWGEYTSKLPRVGEKYQAQFNMAAMVIKAQEDKTVEGGNVASLTVPWGGGGNANEGGTGYRMIWSRDLYHVFTAFLAVGDRAAAARALDFLFKIQQKEDGSFPQNSDLTGKQGWGSLQMDEVGYPLVMAWQLERFDKETYSNHVKRAADFIVKHGPFSPQERWEERPGYSPSTIAAQIAGLVCAADIARRNGDDASAEAWLAKADDWARNVERWTATTKGKYGDGNYYLRISEKGEPDGNHKIELNNNAGTFYEHEIVDAGFLELVRFGIKPADDPLIVKSLKVVDQLLKVKTPNGDAFYRYNNDGYGEMPDGRKWNWDGKYTGKGRPWPLLSGERGQYELALCMTGEKKNHVIDGMNCDDHIRKNRLDAMLKFANEAYMLPEQVWDKPAAPPKADLRFMPDLKFGKGTGSATPLAWSMGAFIRLVTNLKAGKNLDTPQIVFDRYKNGVPAKP